MTWLLWSATAADNIKLVKVDLFQIPKTVTINEQVYYFSVLFYGKEWKKNRHFTSMNISFYTLYFATSITFLDEVLYLVGTQIPGAQIVYVATKYVGPHHGICFISPYWRLELGSGF
jgi:hypothetical protein